MAILSGSYRGSNKFFIQREVVYKEGFGCNIVSSHTTGSRTDPQILIVHPTNAFDYLMPSTTGSAGVQRTISNIATVASATLTVKTEHGVTLYTLPKQGTVVFACDHVNNNWIKLLSGSN